MSDQIVDEENDRTIPIGLFNVADSSISIGVALIILSNAEDLFICRSISSIAAKSVGATAS